MGRKDRWQLYVPWAEPALEFGVAVSAPFVHLTDLAAGTSPENMHRDNRDFFALMELMCQWGRQETNSEKLRQQ